ncbi:MAG: SET domain-containing protein-lysine N-methyltransferase [Gammaproteobacteria bacterium]|nr:SET domain-containing protein-lysine N-methyltransferase [Gammaproteobacteria bacterium]MCF6362150.1 SET domain-containing protein-lysine N-methyltransferase [Gammaproteobacteria bacterium]
MKDGFELRNSSGKGEGIFATKSFTVGDTVMIGVIKEVLNGNHSHASQVGENKFVLHDGLVTKVNHSCDPNCGVRENETGAHNFVAIKEISVNEEITFDYAMRNYIIDYFPQKCMCGSEGCRGRITGWKDLPDKKKKAYEGFEAPYLLELDAKSSCAKVVGYT